MTTSPSPATADKTLSRDLASGALALAIAEIAEDAARLILPYWRSDTAVETKSDDSPVTQADRAAEALILERLAALYPGVQTVAEEAVAESGAPAQAEDWFWLIDPLDGTKGFVRGGEAFTVNIALIHAGRPVAGVVTAPATATTWRTDASGQGAFRRQFGEQQEGEAHSGAEWRPIKVRDRPQEGMALLSHSVSDEEATRLAARRAATRVLPSNTTTAGRRASIAATTSGTARVGEALSVVVIDRLPFASPGDPVLEARLEAVRRRGGNPFRDEQLPQAVIALKQGVGRLIRSHLDRGVLVLCDPRLVTKSYGRLFLDSLPPFPRTRVLADVQDFFAAQSSDAETDEALP